MMTLRPIPTAPDGRPLDPLEPTGALAWEEARADDPRMTRCEFEGEHVAEDVERVAGCLYATCGRCGIALMDSGPEYDDGRPSWERA